MRKIGVVNFMSLDGFFAGPKGEIDWFNSIRKDDEFARYNREHARSGGALIFGRTTYEMMKNYWPTPEAIKDDPDMAGVLDNTPKIVFSKTLPGVLEGPNWKNIRLFHEINREEIMKLKEESGKDMVILGSGTIVQQFANLGLIDGYSLMIVPVVLGEGKPLLKDIKKMDLELLEAKAFKNGVVLLNYRPTNNQGYLQNS